MRTQEPLKRRLPFVAGPVDKIVGVVHRGGSIVRRTNGDTEEEEILHHADDAGGNGEG
jgi:hypothetical protein